MHTRSLHRPKRPGYVLLVTVLGVGSIASVILTSLLMLGSHTSTTGIAVEASHKARSAAEACADVALLRLRESLTYAGGETLTFSEAACDILAIGGSGNNDRTICAEGRSSDVVQRMQITILSVQPAPVIGAWNDVQSFSLCE